MNVTRIGATAVFLLLTSGFLLSLTQTFSSALPLPQSLCQWIPIVAVLLLPLSFLGSPADFWLIGYAAMSSTTVGSILLIIALIIEMSTGAGLATDFHLESYQSFSTAFGAILFAFGGASAFPTFQMDMKRKEQFPLAVVFGFAGLLLLYIPAAGLGYAAYGYQVHANIIENMPPGPVVRLIEVCFLVHCFTVVLIVISPVFLDLEELCRVPKRKLQRFVLSKFANFFLHFRFHLETLRFPHCNLPLSCGYWTVLPKLWPDSRSDRRKHRHAARFCPAANLLFKTLHDRRSLQ